MKEHALFAQRMKRWFEGYSKSHFFASVCLVCGIGFGILRFNSFQVGAYVDDAHYIVLAQSLAAERGYRLINYPSEPPEWAFPPGWPLLLSIPIRIFPDNLSVLKLVSFTMCFVSSILLYKLLNDYFVSYTKMIFAMLVFLNPYLIGISGMVMSEAVYLLFSFLSIFLFIVWEHKNGFTNHLVYIAFLVSMFSSQLIRSVGISLFMATLVYLTLKGRFRITVSTFVFGTVGLILQQWVMYRGKTITSAFYQSQLLDYSIPEKINHTRVNLFGYLDEVITNSVFPVFGPAIDSFFDSYLLNLIPGAINYAFIGITVLGLVVSLRNYKIFDLYLIFYFLGLLLFWIPNYGGMQARYIIPIIPLLSFYFLRGMGLLPGNLRGRKSHELIGRISVVIVFGILMTRNLQDVRDPIRNHMTDLSIGSTWIKENTPSDSIVMTRRPVSYYLYMHRRTISFPGDEQDLTDYVVLNDVAYVLISPPIQSRGFLDEYGEKTLREILQSPELFTPVFSDSFNEIYVFKVRS